MLGFSRGHLVSQQAHSQSSLDRWFGGNNLVYFSKPQHITSSTHLSGLGDAAYGFRDVHFDDVVDLQNSNLARFIVNVCNAYASTLLIHTNVCLYFLVLDKVGAKLTLQVCVLKTPTQNLLKMMNGYEKYLHFTSEMYRVWIILGYFLLQCDLSRNLNNAIDICGIRPVV